VGAGPARRALAGRAAGTAPALFRAPPAGACAKVGPPETAAGTGAVATGAVATGPEATGAGPRVSVAAGSTAMCPEPEPSSAAGSATRAAASRSALARIRSLREEASSSTTGAASAGPAGRGLLPPDGGCGAGAGDAARANWSSLIGCSSACGSPPAPERLVPESPPRWPRRHLRCPQAAA
jgi:hypothetical protein